MELTNNQRQTLVDELKNCVLEKELITKLFDSETAKNELWFMEATEIRAYLNQEKIKTIEKALIDNDIDY